MYRCTRIIVMMPILAMFCTYPSARDQMEECAESPLVDAVRREGELRVIVTLATTHRPEADLTAQAAAEQRRRIASLQAQLISELEGTAAIVVRQSERLPLLSMRVDEAALCRILESALVRTTERDREDPPGG